MVFMHDKKMYFSEIVNPEKHSMVRIKNIYSVAKCRKKKPWRSFVFFKASSVHSASYYIFLLIWRAQSSHYRFVYKRGAHKTLECRLDAYTFSVCRLYAYNKHILTAKNNAQRNPKYHLLDCAKYIHFNINLTLDLSIQRPPKS